VVTTLSGEHNTDYTIYIDTRRKKRSQTTLIDFYEIGKSNSEDY